MSCSTSWLAKEPHLQRILEVVGAVGDHVGQVRNLTLEPALREVAELFRWLWVVKEGAVSGDSLAGLPSEI